MQTRTSGFSLITALFSFAATLNIITGIIINMHDFYWTKSCRNVKNSSAGPSALMTDRPTVTQTASSFLLVLLTSLYICTCRLSPTPLCLRGISLLFGTEQADQINVRLIKEGSMLKVLQERKSVQNRNEALWLVSGRHSGSLCILHPWRHVPSSSKLLPASSRGTASTAGMS